MLKLFLVLKVGGVKNFIVVMVVGRSVFRMVRSNIVLFVVIEMGERVVWGKRREGIFFV